MRAASSQSPPPHKAVRAYARIVFAAIAGWAAYSPFLRHPFVPTSASDWLGGLGAIIAGLALAAWAVAALPKHPRAQRLWHRWACVPLSLVPLVAYRFLDDSPYYLQTISNSMFYLPVLLCAPAFAHSVLEPVRVESVQARQAVLKTLAFATGVVMAIPLPPILHVLTMDPFAGDSLCLVAICLYIVAPLQEIRLPGTTSQPTATSAPNNPPDTMALHMHLTPREHQVFMLLVAGRTAGRIASFLGIERSTVVTHIRSIYIKAGVHSQQELLDLVFPAHNTEQPRA